MTHNELVKALKRADRLLRPCAIICNPKVADIIKDNFDKTHKIIVTDLVDTNKVYIVDRKHIEDYIENIDFSPIQI